MGHFYTDVGSFAGYTKDYGVFTNLRGWVNRVFFLRGKENVPSDKCAVQVRLHLGNVEIASEVCCVVYGEFPLCWGNIKTGVEIVVHQAASSLLTVEIVGLSENVIRVNVYRLFDHCWFHVPDIHKGVVLFRHVLDSSLLALDRSLFALRTSV